MEIIIGLISVLILTTVIGSIPHILTEKGRIDISKSLLIGMSIMIITGRYFYRTSLPIEICKYILILLFLISIIYIKYQKYNYACKDINGIYCSIPILFILLFPIWYGNLFIFHYGPDLLGNLISSSYLINNGSFSDLAAKYTEIIGNSRWWSSARQDPWGIANMTDSIAIEFFLRSVRWGHAAYVSLTNNIFNIDTGRSFLILMIISALITGIIIFKKLRENLDLLGAILVGMILLSSQSYVVMLYEGINIQFIVIPFILYLIFNIDSLTIKDNINESITYGILISALMTTFGEGFQLLGVYFVIYLILIGIKNLENIKILLKNIWHMSIVIIISGQMFIFDYITWVLNRIKDDFTGGILHYDFNILDLIIQIPIYSVIAGMNHDSLVISNLSIISNKYIIALLIIIGIYEYWVNNNKIIICSSIIIFLVFLTEHKYALWKTVIIFQIPIIISLINTYSLKIRNIQKIIFVFLIIIYTYMQFMNIKLIKEYKRHSEMIAADEIINNKPKIMNNYAILTPSKKFRYLNLANYGEFIWINGGFRQFGFKNIPKIDEHNYKIFVYYDCNIESYERCNLIKNSSKKIDKKFYETDYRVEDLLINGEVSDEKTNKLIKEIFGVDAK